MSERTPGLWKVCGTMIFGGHKPDIGSYAVAQTFMDDEQGEPVADEAEQEANAEFIVRCVNAHDELLKAIRDILESAGFEGGEAEPTLHELNVNIRVLNNARAALAKAEPPQP